MKIDSSIMESRFVEGKFPVCENFSFCTHERESCEQPMFCFVNDHSKICFASNRLEADLITDYMHESREKLPVASVERVK